MKESPRISTLFPDIFNVHSPITVGSNALIVSASLLSLKEVQILPMVQGLQPVVDHETKIKMFATLGEYSVLEAIGKSEPRDYLKLLWTECDEVPTWIGSVKFSDTLDDLLNVFQRTKFGNAAIEDESMGHPGLVTLKDIVSLYRSGRLRTSVRVSEISSERVSTPLDSTITDALQLMFKKRIRRVFHAGYDLQFTSSRDIIRFLFSPQKLEAVKKTPGTWLDARLSDFVPSRANSVPDGAPIIEAARQIGDGVDDCLVCESNQQIVSRWDIVMKPWEEGIMGI